MSNERKRQLDDPEAATGENAKSKAAKFYIRMAGGTTAVPDGAIAELLQQAEDQGSVTPEDIAVILDSPDLRVRYHSEWSVGDE